ncbi:MAG: AraC family transcriptional regulator [Treponema sp.]|nr:AraC family transcriptional regulator [Treponema sp.]
MTKVSKQPKEIRPETETRKKSVPLKEQVPVHEEQQRGSIIYPLQYNLCNTANKYYDLWLHWHNEFELIHIISGEYNLFMDNHEIHMKKDDFCLIPGKVIHGDAQVKGLALYESIVFDIDMVRLHSYASDLFINDIVSSTVSLESHITSDHKDILSLGLQLFENIKAHPSGYEMISSGCLLMFLGLMKKEGLYREKKILPAHKRARNDQLDLVLNLIRNNFSQDLTLQQMADIAGLSPKYFCRIFREMMEKSPIEYLNWFRINRACNMLRETEDKLPDIAYNCGFNDFSYFIKTFRRYKGMTPLKYRNFDPIKFGQANSIGADISEGLDVGNSLAPTEE